MTSSVSHGLNIGAQGDFTSKTSGLLSFGYTLLDFDDPETGNQDNFTTTFTLDHKHNSKTNSSYSLSRAFSPTAQGFSTFSTTFSASLNHKFTEKWSSRATLNTGVSEYTYVDSKPSKSKNYGLSLSSTIRISQMFDLETGYNLTLTDNNNESYSRHVIYAQTSTNF